MYEDMDIRYRYIKWKLKKWCLDNSLNSLSRNDFTI